MTTTKGLRFAAWVRVSTEGQQKKGESLPVQRATNTRNVERLEGTIVGWYGGAEHATPGHEKAEFSRLLADAKKGKFDAVIMAKQDRWGSGRDASDKESLEILKAARVRFFVAATELDLYNPEHRFILGLQATVGEFFAANQKRSSLLSRIAKARRGVPTTGGSIPYGRTYDRKTETWGVDEKKKAIIQDAAERYLRGESLPALAKEYGISHSQLCLILRESCGDKWEVNFTQADLDINEDVTITIPRLLDDATIKCIKQRLEANRTYIRSGGRPIRKDGTKSDYLLSGKIFCAACGSNMCGHLDRLGVPHYRHESRDRSGRCSLRPRPYILASKIEAEVIGQLFDLFGNPAAIARSVKAAVPDADKAIKRRDRLKADMAKVAKEIDRIIGLVASGGITQEQALPQLATRKERAAALQEEYDKVAGLLESIPDEETLERYVLRVTEKSFTVTDGENEYPGGNDIATFAYMTPEEKRRLVDAVFDAPLPDGTPSGIYVSLDGPNIPHRPKKWSFRIRGRLDFELVMQSAAPTVGASTARRRGPPGWPAASRCLEPSPCPCGANPVTP
jgi:site-specific DNA recombinase